MSLHVERLATLVRCYREGECFEAGDEPVATAVIARTEAGQVEIMAGHGQISRRNMRRLLAVAAADGPRGVVVKRRRGHGVPFGRLVGSSGGLDIYLIEPTELARLVPAHVAPTCSGTIR